MRSNNFLMVYGDSQPIGNLLSVRAAAVYGMRQFYSNYLGAAIRVRRSSDNAEVDIGFTANGDLDVAALLDFVGAGNGFVTTWYDQSGNVRNVTQATAASQPSIVTSGVVNTVNGKPSPAFDGVDDYMESFAASVIAQGDDTPWSAIWVMNYAAGSTIRHPIQFSTTTTSELFMSILQINTNNTSVSSQRRRTIVGDAPSIAGTNTKVAVGAIFGNVFSGTTGEVFVDGTSIASGALNTAAFDAYAPNVFTIGALKRTVITGYTNMTMAEVVFTNNAISRADRQLLERSQGNYFGIAVN